MTIQNIRRHSGIAGQFAVSAEVTYPGEPMRAVTFTGSTYGGPVVMTTEGAETFVTDPGRFGKFGETWVRKFFEAA
jgi:hypothetical protein